MNILSTYSKLLKKIIIYQCKLGVDLSLVIEYSLTIMNNNRLNIAYLGNAKPKCALSFRNFRSFSAHFGMAFLRRDYD